jgi:Carboxypeptidase regulatory-like domain
MLKFRVYVAAVLFLMSGRLMFGQVAGGTINVQVQDTSGALVPGTSVTLKHTGTGQVRQGSTNERGEFLASFLPIGTYALTAEARGFKTKTVTGLELLIDQYASIVVRLDPGDVHEIVEVTDIMPLLDTNTSSLGQVIANKRILELPLNGRNPFALGLLAGNTTPMVGMGSNLPFIAGSI